MQKCNRCGKFTEIRQGDIPDWLFETTFSWGYNQFYIPNDKGRYLIQEIDLQYNRLYNMVCHCNVEPRIELYLSDGLQGELFPLNMMYFRNNEMNIKLGIHYIPIVVYHKVYDSGYTSYGQRVTSVSLLLSELNGVKQKNDPVIIEIWGILYDERKM